MQGTLGVTVQICMASQNCASFPEQATQIQHCPLHTQSPDTPRHVRTQHSSDLRPSPEAIARNISERLGRAETPHLTTAADQGDESGGLHSLGSLVYDHAVKLGAHGQQCGGSCDAINLLSALNVINGMRGARSDCATLLHAPSPRWNAALKPGESQMSPLHEH